MATTRKRFTRTLRLALGTAVAASALTTATTASAPQARAVSYGWVYVAFPSWLGNCPGSSVAGVQADVSGLWSTNWDLGDDIVYAKVRLGANNTLNYNLMCKKGRYLTGYQAGSATIRPSRTKQTVWVGPAGVRYN